VINRGDEKGVTCNMHGETKDYSKFYMEMMKGRNNTETSAYAVE
jgi:hypothetical protein